MVMEVTENMEEMVKMAKTVNQGKMVKMGMPEVEGVRVVMEARLGSASLTLRQNFHAENIDMEVLGAKELMEALVPKVAVEDMVELAEEEEKEEEMVEAVELDMESKKRESLLLECTSKNS